MITEFQDGFITKTKLNELVGGINANSERLAELDVIVLTGDITKTVGNGGDFTTLNLAINWCKKLTPNGYKVTISIIGGTIIQESLIFKNIDLRFVEIISSDSSVITIDGNYLTPNYVLTFTPFIYSENSVVPKISFSSILINEPSTSNGNFAFITNGSTLELKQELSISDYPSAIRVEYGSSLIANSIIIYGGTSGVTATEGSRVTMWYSTILCTIYGISSLQSSNINAIGCVCSNASNGFTVSEGGIISANTSTGTLSQTANTITASGIIFK